MAKNMIEGYEIAVSGVYISLSSETGAKTKKFYKAEKFQFPKIVKYKEGMKKEVVQTREDGSVITRTVPAGPSPPGTQGFHQIQLVHSGVISHVDEIASVNQGVVSGVWEISGSQVNRDYAHEAGHLFGLDDRYEAYNKQADGTWKIYIDCFNLNTSN